MYSGQEQGITIVVIGASRVGLPTEICVVLDSFEGESSLKSLFWELLSYDRVRDPLPFSFLPPSALEFTAALEVFASSDAATIVLASVRFIPDGGRLEQMTWALKRHIPNCVVLLQHGASWSLIFPDEIYKPRVRFLPLPGPADKRAETAQAIASLNAANDGTGDELSALELAQNLDESFPGVTPNIADVMTEFERIAQHPEPEIRDLWPLIRQAGKYPLLTPAQERGEDLRGDETAQDGTGLTFQEWRLVVHNLRLVVWIARRWRGRGVELADLVQEGTIGLMTAARRYDPNRGTRFGTLAYWWVLQGITRAISNCCNLIRWPVYKAPELMKAARDENWKGLTAGEKPPVYLPFLFNVPAYDGGDPFDPALRLETTDAVRKVLSELKPKEQIVISRRFGIGTDDEETLEQIGNDMSVTRERIRQIEAKALKHLHKRNFEMKLRPYYDSVQWRIHHAPNVLKPYDPDHPVAVRFFNLTGLTE